MYKSICQVWHLNTDSFTVFYIKIVKKQISGKEKTCDIDYKVLFQIWQYIKDIIQKGIESEKIKKNKSICKFSSIQCGSFVLNSQRE